MGVQPLLISRGVRHEEQTAILEELCGAVPAGSIVTLDVTHGLRHLQFLLYAAAVYLRSLRGVSIAGAYSGAYEAMDADKVAPS